jgi:hypothetical protein
VRVLHLPAAGCGNPWALATAERRMGLHSDVLVTAQDPYGYPAGINLHLERARSKYERYWRLALAFLRIRNRYDVFHFNSGTALLNFPHRGLHHLELPMYPRGKKLFVTFSGCDARQKYPTISRTAVSACRDEHCYGGVCNSGEKDRQRRAGIAKMARHVRHCWAQNPDLLRFLPAGQSSFLPYAVALADGDRTGWREPGRRLRIVHAPTQRAAKGTAHILAAVQRLERSHPGAFDFSLVENTAHRDALKRYADADLVIDQVLVGWYGNLAVEAMLMHKPVIARIDRDDLRFVPPRMAMEVPEAIIDAGPDSLYPVLARCVEARAWLKQRALAGQAYAQRWHDPGFVASLTVRRYEQSLDEPIA